MTPQAQLRPVLPPPLASQLQHYRPGSGYDELVTPDGQLRPHWLPLLHHLDHMGERSLQRLRQECQRLLRESGVTHNLYGGAKAPSRPWELDPLPYLLDAAEWSQLERGLQQRSRLLGMLLGDLLGPRHALKEGLLPPEVVFSHPAWSSAYAGLSPTEEAPLTLSAVDLARRDDGRFHVLGDMTDAPAGAGYALENRLILTRMLPDVFRAFHIQRLLPFFQLLRNNLERLAPPGRDDPHIVLLASDLADETHFEQVFLANYLGLTLALGDDLTVRNGRAALKTLDGLRTVDVILRRIADAECDPLELCEQSRSGIVGMLQSIRMGNVAMASPPGAGLLENHGLLPYLPRLCRFFLGEELLLPSLPTWWCGDPQQRQYVMDNLSGMVIKPIRAQPGLPPLFGDALDAAGRSALMARLEGNPWLYVGQERFIPSTVPVMTGDSIEPHTMVVRTFASAGREGIQVMPGGQVRFAARAPDRPHKFWVSKGMWVLSEAPIEWTPRVRALRPIQAAPLVGELPSRVAENLFWVGRYAERTEYTLRTLRVILRLLLEETGLTDQERRHCIQVLTQAFNQATGTGPMPPPDGLVTPASLPHAELFRTILDEDLGGSVSNTLKALIQAAQAVRERFSPDTWQVIQNLRKGLEGMQTRPPRLLPDLLREADAFIHGLTAFSGQTMESMTRGQGWQFLISGRRLERAMFTVQLVDGTLVREVNETLESAVLELLLTITDGLITFRRRYHSRLDVAPVLDLVLLDETNPRSLAFQLAGLDNHAAALPRQRRMPPYRSPEGHITLEALNALRLAQPEQLSLVTRSSGNRPNLEKLLQLQGNLLPLFSVTLSHSFFQHTQARKQLAPIF